MKLIIFSKKIFYTIFIILLIIFFGFVYSYNKNFISVASSSEIKDLNLENKLKSISNNEKVAYLTFDDGPTLKATAKVLDILKKCDVKASFFVVGKHVKEQPNLVKRAYDEGHYIANHGYNHNNSKLYKSVDSFVQEIKNTDNEIGKAIGVENYCSHIFRFPNGFTSKIYKNEKKLALKSLANMNYYYIDWNCLNNDSIKKYSSYQLLSNLKKSSKNKDVLVVLMHDTADVSDSTLVLEDSINYLKEQGYIFKNFYNITSTL